MVVQSHQIVCSLLVKPFGQIIGGCRDGLGALLSQRTRSQTYRGSRSLIWQNLLCTRLLQQLILSLFHLIFQDSLVYRLLIQPWQHFYCVCVTGCLSSLKWWGWEFKYLLLLFFISLVECIFVQTLKRNPGVFNEDHCLRDVTLTLLLRVNVSLNRPRSAHRLRPRKCLWTAVASWLATCLF